ncbi:MAG: glycosyltransferase family 4 protein [Acidobacteriota bacterium]
MTRIALCPSEPIRRRMAGIGIRYYELARRLPRPGLEIVLLNPGDVDQAKALDGMDGVDVRRFEPDRLRELVADCQGAVAQGQLANNLLVEVPELPTAIDLYDPFLVENLNYFDTLGLDPYRNDHATWVLQMAEGDFFLCSSDEQRQFYLGFLSAVGRLNPRRLKSDPDLAGLIQRVPFGVPEQLPPHQPLLPERAKGERRLLFGGLYDWYDPWTVLQALEQLDPPQWILYFIRNPNPDSTPQTLAREVEAWCTERGWWGERVQMLDWVRAERRYDLLREVDLLVSTHRINLETRLSLRTRFLDAMAAGCPVVTSEGGAMSRLLEQHGAGWVVPEEDPAALAEAFQSVLTRDDERSARGRAAEELLEAFSWERVLEPLVRFCQAPQLDPTKAEFAFRPTTQTPPDALGFRIKRRLKQWLRSARGIA